MADKECEAAAIVSKSVANLPVLRLLQQILISVEAREKFSCPLGETPHIFSDPVQLPCGHRFCKPCVLHVTPGTVCPGCQDEGDGNINIINAGELIPDPAFRKELDRQSAQCGHEGCRWKGVYKLYSGHEQICVCDCTREIPQHLLLKHREKECSHRAVNCQHCHVILKVIDTDNHVKVCGMAKIDCPNKCGEKLYRKDVDAHVDTVTGGCKMKTCPFGCKITDSEEHRSDFISRHVLMLLKMINTTKDSTLSARPRTSDYQLVEERMKALENRFAEVYGRLNQDIVLRQGSADVARSDSQTVISVDASSRRSAESAVGVAATGGVCNRPARASALPLSEELTSGRVDVTSGLVQKLDVTEALVVLINRQLEHVLHTSTEMKLQSRAQEEEISVLRGRVTSLESSLIVQQRTLAETHLRLQRLESTSFDGTYVWVISDVTRKRQEAVSGRALSHYSMPFRTSRSGYKMCLRIYLNGDGMGRGTHISLFFVIMRGQYDAVLPWPFKQKVSMMLLDQNNRKEHVVDAFRPDPTSSSFRRPQSDMNIASGVPLFCPLSKLEDRATQYVRDDTLFIKAVVSTD